jgi:hypothetical protein
LAESLPETAAQKEYQFCCFFLVVFIRLDTNALMKQPKSLKKTSSGLLGALAIASGSSAYAAVVSVAPPPDLSSTPGGATTTENWDVNLDGIVDFGFQNRYPNSGTHVNWQLNFYPVPAGNGVVGYVGPFINYADALSFGTSIGPASTFQTSAQVCLGSNYGGTLYGGFAVEVPPGTNAYAGFQFTAADGIHYGWVFLNINAGIIDFTSAAYESTPGVAITAGAVPEPGTMAMLALGAVGVLGVVAKRRRS